MTEFAQLEELGVYEAVDAALLTKEQRRAALRAINLIKLKRDGKMKVRTVADGSVQRSLYDKLETASPTVATDALILSILIDSYEGRDVVTADVAGAYLKAYMDEFVLMKLTGESVDILCNMNPTHLKFVVIENGVKTLYVKLIKAIYGCVKSALLCYDLFSSTLQKMGFELNPYDPCVANVMIGGKQCTVVWYVDDNKISRVDPDVVTRVVEVIEKHFGKVTVTRGRQRTCFLRHADHVQRQWDCHRRNEELSVGSERRMRNEHYPAGRRQLLLPGPFSMRTLCPNHCPRQTPKSFIESWQSFCTFPLGPERIYDS